MKNKNSGWELEHMKMIIDGFLDNVELTGAESVELSEHLEEIEKLKKEVKKWKNSSKKLSSENKKLKKELQEYKDYYDRFDILDFGD
jgi:predicted RNase H-like nuclease (RuvC/YqgF family)